MTPAFIQMHSFSSTSNPSIRRGLEWVAFVDFKLVRFFIVTPLSVKRHLWTMTSIGAPLLSCPRGRFMSVAGVDRRVTAGTDSANTGARPNPVMGSG
jgi:hypothetical protein